MTTTFPARAGRRRQGAVLIAVAAGALVAASSASATPSISGADTDVWNAANPVPTYVIGTDGPTGAVRWSVGTDEGSGAAPLTVRLPQLADGRYTLRARDLGRGPRPNVLRSFTVDRTPPAITVGAPTEQAVVPLGATLTADYTCTGAVTCVGTVASGAALDTSVAGPATFAVRATDAAGNEAVAQVPFTVLAAATEVPSTPASTETSAPAGGGTPPAEPILLTPSPPTGSVSPGVTPAPVRPRTLNARLLRPAAGSALTTRRPVLRWRARRGARLYNVQVFRLRGTRATKVLSAFPRGTSMRVPARRLLAGARYVWRVWPYLGPAYTSRPLGIAWFDVRRGARG